MGKHGWVIGLLCMFSGCLAFAGVVQTLAMRNFIDFAAAGDRHGFFHWFAIYLGLIFFQLVSGAVYRLAAASANLSLFNKLRGRCFSCILSRKFSALRYYHSGDFMQRLINDSGVVASTAVSLLPEDDSRFNYYEDVWEKAVPEEGFPGVFRLKPEDEYIYYILHLFKHVLYAGTGIRSFLDSLVYRKIWPDMNQDYLRQEFEKLEMTGFVRCVETIADCWFETGTPVPVEMDVMADSILSAGTYGSEDRRFRNEMKEIGGKLKHPFVVKIVYLLSCLFLPLKAMRQLYPVLTKVPVLLPMFWIWRPISRLLFRPEALTNLVKQTNEEGDKLWSEYNWQEFQSK